jgi:hypothetical protein
MFESGVRTLARQLRLSPVFVLGMTKEGLAHGWRNGVWVLSGPPHGTSSTSSDG